MHRFKCKNGKKAKKIMITMVEEDWGYLRTYIDTLKDIAVGLNHGAKSELGERLAVIACDLESITCLGNVNIDELDFGPTECQD